MASVWALRRPVKRRDPLGFLIFVGGGVPRRDWHFDNIDMTLQSSEEQRKDNQSEQIQAGVSVRAPIASLRHWNKKAAEIHHG